MGIYDSLIRSQPAPLTLSQAHGRGIPTEGDIVLGAKRNLKPSGISSAKNIKVGRCKSI